MKPAAPAVPGEIEDRGERTALMGPLLVAEGSRHRAELTDLVVELAARSAGFRRSLPDGVRSGLATLVRATDCYYSNLIEGHHTHPVDIERALNGDYGAEPEPRDLQLEAKAHIDVQEWIDRGGLKGRAATVAGLTESHRRFCQPLPDALRWIEEPGTRERVAVVPGALRERHVRVGGHAPVSPGAVPRFLDRFEAVYSRLGTTDTVLAAAAAHHRLLWIHPFLDGNGRVARLMSHAMLRDALDTGGVWSIARGLGRQADTYKAQLAACDLSRRNDLDGRGNLSEEALAEFTQWFLRLCLDQVQFMERLVAPDRLHGRIMVWAEEEARAGTLPPKSAAVLEAVLFRGELPRGDLPNLLGSKERQARRVTSALLKHGVLQSDSSRAPLRLAFPARLASRWLPGLFPEAAD